jgi:hypothetical protein
MKLTKIQAIAQPPRPACLVVISMVLFAACSSRGGSVTIPPPVDPEATVRSFMNAVKANSLVGMGELWGTADGPASVNMERATLDQRLTVIRIYLEHESFDIVSGDPVVGADIQPGERAVFVRLTRKGCTPTVPFTLVPYRDGWLIRNIDLAAAGNPSRRCTPDSVAGRRG